MTEQQITNATHGTRIIAEDGPRRLIEIYPHEGEPRGDRYYIVEWDNESNQVYSLLPEDFPPAGSGASTYYAGGLSARSITHVANGMSARDANRRWQNLTATQEDVLK